MFQRFLFWPLFAAVIGVAFGGSIGSGLPLKYAQTPQQQETGGYADQRSEQTDSKRSLWVPTNPTEFFTFWVAIFTLVLAGSTIGLWYVTYRGIQLGRDEFNATHRPKVRLKHLWLAEDILPNEPISVNLFVVNNGSADAILQQIGVRYDIVPLPGPLPINPSIDVARVGNGARLQPGLNYEFSLIDIGRVISIEEFDSLTDNLCDLYCIGYISYHDAVGRMRITGFCRRLQFERRAPIQPDNSRFVPVDDPDYEYED